MKARIEIEVQTGDLVAALGLEHEIFDLGYGSVNPEQLSQLAVASSTIPFISIRPEPPKPD